MNQHKKRRRMTRIQRIGFLSLCTAKEYMEEHTVLHSRKPACNAKPFRIYSFVDEGFIFDEYFCAY